MLEAEELARADLLDILSSDYVPGSLILGAARLAQLWGDVPQAFAASQSGAARGKLVIEVAD